MNILSNTPMKQIFFSFDKNLAIEKIVETIEKIIENSMENGVYSITLKTYDESYSLPKIDDLSAFYNKYKKEVDMIVIAAHGNNSTMFHIVFQFNNINTGQNGNFTLMFGSKHKNTEAFDIIWQELSLKELNLQKKMIQNNKQMIVEPIFINREFVTRERTCFVLMPFTLSWSERVYNKLKAICTINSYEIKRADSLYGANVLEDIWNAINESSIIIADTTGKNPNVFYEIGIAHTLGKKVILITQDFEDIPFDFRNYRHIIYEDNVDGFEKLTSELPNFL